MSPDTDADADTDPPPPVTPALRAGVALFNEGYYLAAHEPWEAAWLPLESGADERLLHGLIAATAATFHATDHNWSGATGCADNAAGYLAGVEAGHREVALTAIREWCRRLNADPETIERTTPPTIQIDEHTVGFDDLALQAALLAAPALATAVEPGDESTLEAAASLARTEHGTGRTTVTDLVMAYLKQPETRPQVAMRIADHVERLEWKSEDVDGLFE